jgi:hypothetical protein
MYPISDQEIDFILNDIRARGIEQESLRLNLLDHICIIIEENLEAEGDFEQFYLSVIPTFYKKELRELEDAAVFLINNQKNFTMKKAMIIIGACSVTAFMSGSISKILHTNLTDFLLFSGFVSFVFLFLPLVFIVKIKEIRAKTDQLIFASGSIVGILYFFCMLLKFISPNWPGFLGPRWPHMEMIWLTIWLIALGIGLFVFIPVYFFAGIRKPEAKMNTIVTTVLLVAFIGIQFTFTNLRPSVRVTQRQDRAVRQLPVKNMIYAKQSGVDDFRKQ